MIVFVDSESKIRAVDKTSDESLTPLFIDETNAEFPFKGWSKAKICCYKITFQDGVITMYTPYVDSRLLDQIDMMGHQIENQAPFTALETASSGDSEIVFTGVPEGVVTIDARDLEGNNISYHANRDEDILRVFFDEPLSYAADIRIIVN